jgi:hypothetical protein
MPLFGVKEGYCSPMRWMTTNTIYQAEQSLLLAFQYRQGAVLPADCREGAL